jgi:hypothetical protein
MFLALGRIILLFNRLAIEVDCGILCWLLSMS